MLNSSPMARGLLAAMLATTLHGTALAAPTTTHFDPAAQVAGTKLQLNGAGTRFKAIFKVYDMALYTPRKVGTPEELMALPGAKRLQFTALRELPGTDLGRLFIRGMGDNAPRELIQKHALSSTRLIEIFSGRSKLNPGDTFAMDFIPGKGTQFYIQGQAQGEPVGDAEFFGMVLSIWFGAQPADRLLEQNLLGHEKEGN
ncbi:MAG: chalcone isomerase family protein [Burkholderiales bacterium]